ncbi:hypothetical protein [Amycolatopsis keratiniphila]|uniref:Uncharacterized protein n=1 Tax=Amycolatopsis keratiniphila subsp. keratiniphila TaxID=227715 RepID=A0A1W2LHF5_9PSEU|nr:hypothetical protein [Amycolatopsis keratiniphila]ONF62291.1 hypothetical protein AVR91_0238675 [Amycolatopsis keratiniphila subsp. keratiniphila]
MSNEDQAPAVAPDATAPEGTAAGAATSATDDAMIAALLRERAAYAGRGGMEDRVKAVDEQLALRGYTEPAETETGAPAAQGDGPPKDPKPATAKRQQTR